MFSHVMVGCADLARAERFYDAVLLPLGLLRRQVVPDGGPPAACWVHPDSALPRFYVTMPQDRGAASPGNGSMVAFLAASATQVRESYQAGMAAGGTDAGLPGPRPAYGEGYFGGYIRDPDGNKLHIVHRGDI